MPRLLNDCALSNTREKKPAIDLITIQSKELSENQLAGLALAIQNRFGIAAFVKMHEIVVMDDDENSAAAIGQLPSNDFERGLEMILDRLEMSPAFRLEKAGRQKYRLAFEKGASLPSWMTEADTPGRVPEGVYECPHCVPPDTLILGDNKPMAHYDEGDTAVGQTGLNDVIQTFVRPYDGEMVTIKANGMLPITTTPEHPILAAASRSIERRQGRDWHCEIQFWEGRWVAAKDVVAKTTNKDGNYVILPIIPGTFEKYLVGLFPFIKPEKPHRGGYREYFPLNEDTAWLLGLYTAEGSAGKEVRFSLNRNDGEIKAKVSGIAQQLGYSAYTRYLENKNSMVVGIPSGVLARAFDNWCGHKDPNKKIPDFILYHKDEKIVKSFLDGYETGHAHDVTNKLRGNKTYRQSSTPSRILAQQLQLAYVRLHTWASIRIKNRQPEGMLMERKCSLHFEYIVSYPQEPNVDREKVRFLKDKVLCPIRSITKERYNGEVYNIETSDNTYLVSNAILHNCGKWFNNDVEFSAHTKLHYII